MNNKGQTLVLFVLLLPILFILIAIVVDIGTLYIDKVKMQNVVKMVIEDELKCENCEQESSNQRISQILNKNIKNIVIDKLDVNKNYILIKVSKKNNSIFSLILKEKFYNIKLSYEGIKRENKIIIKRGD